MTEKLYHCQICGRAIKLVKGYPKADRHLGELNGPLDRNPIAHHGYQRPGSGWQTASCFGARWRPYEAACDALPKAIESVERFRDQRVAYAAELAANPPRGFEVRPDRNSYKSFDPFSVLRPADFSADKSFGSWRPRSYESQYWPARRNAEHDVEQANSNIEHFRKRLADWKPNV